MNAREIFLGVCVWNRRIPQPLDPVIDLLKQLGDCSGPQDPPAECQAWISLLEQSWWLVCSKLFGGGFCRSGLTSLSSCTMSFSLFLKLLLNNNPPKLFFSCLKKCYRLYPIRGLKKEWERNSSCYNNLPTLCNIRQRMKVSHGGRGQQAGSMEAQGQDARAGDGTPPLLSLNLGTLWSRHESAATLTALSSITAWNTWVVSRVVWKRKQLDFTS